MRILSTLVFAFTSLAVAQDDVVMKAMRDELARSMKKLQLENLEKPYYIAYRVYDNERTYVSASFGALNGSFDQNRSRFARVQVRVGDYNLDNGNFYSPSFGSRFSTGAVTMPLDDNYDEIRRQLWLATDGAYKKALEDLAKKRAMLANKNRSEAVPDFSREKPTSTTDLLPPANFEMKQLEATVRDLSAIYKEFPETIESTVSMTISNELIRSVNSEGALLVARYPEVQLSIGALAKAADGQPLSSGVNYRGRSLADLPSHAEIAGKIRLRAQQLADLRNAPLPERYAGPILFEGEAAPEIFWSEFAGKMIAVPTVLSDNTRNAPSSDSENLVEKIGLRILPDFLGLVDDPTLNSIAGHRLFGTFKVDDDGVPSHRVELVEGGVLKTLLTGRAPVQGILHSSGSTHYGGVVATNLILSSSKAMKIEELRAELIRRAKLRGKEYAYIVRKVDYSTRNGENNGIARGATPVLLAYKYYADGHEELVRNAIVNGLTFASFKDILAVSDTPAVWTLFGRPRGTSPYDSPGSSLVSVAVPSLLFEDATVQRPTGSVSKPPLSEHPYFTKK